MVTNNGNSPLTVRGLDPGIMYSVTINVFNGNQVVFRNETIMKTITVMGDQPGKIICTYVHVRMLYICTYVLYTYALTAALSRLTIVSRKAKKKRNNATTE